MSVSKNKTMTKYLFYILIFILSTIQVAASMELEGRDHIEELSEEETVRGLKRSLLLNRINPPSAIYFLKERFKKKAKVWEKTHRRPLKANDLLKPFLNERGELRPCNVAERLYGENNEKFKHVLAVSKSWITVGNFFTGDIDNDIYNLYPYEWLFGFQIILEAFSIGADGEGNLIYLPLFLRSESDSFTVPPIKGGFLPIRKLTEFVNTYRENYTSEEYRRYVPASRLVDCLAGLVLDPVKESCISCLCRLLLCQSSTSSSDTEALPQSRPDASWEYMHRIRGDFGMTVFMHIFPQLRSVCKTLADYGIGRDVIGDTEYTDLIRPFLHPPHVFSSEILAIEDDLSRTSAEAAPAASASAAAGTE